jgi:hypothetical protein
MNTTDCGGSTAGFGRHRQKYFISLKLKSISMISAVIYSSEWPSYLAEPALPHHVAYLIPGGEAR